MVQYYTPASRRWPVLQNIQQHIHPCIVTHSTYIPYKCHKGRSELRQNVVNECDVISAMTISCQRLLRTCWLQQLLEGPWIGGVESLMKVA